MTTKYELWVLHVFIEAASKCYEEGDLIGGDKEIDNVILFLEHYKNEFY